MSVFVDFLLYMTARNHVFPVGFGQNLARIVQDQICSTAHRVWT